MTDKLLTPFTVTPELLNEVNTLAAPSMLAVALRAAHTELGQAIDKLALYSYQAEFKQGAREGDQVRVAIERLADPSASDPAYQVRFATGEDTTGRVGKWHLQFGPQSSNRLLPYNLAPAFADDRTDRSLWRPDAAVASGDSIHDGQTLLWLAGQSARSYFRRLDQALVAEVAPGTLQDDPNQRNYGGIKVIMTFAGRPESGCKLYCVPDYQLPLNRQKPGKLLDFQEMLVGEVEDHTFLLGVARFTVVRMSGGAAVYPNGSKEKPE
ncbi:MAG: hypothetical protein V2J55_00600 [Candidatus Competibacteraceae bacterium]|jgi:hypothetical protein|nr:hypothetical protein [Candidatus Competibacteraceae bacterium]